MSEIKQYKITKKTIEEMVEKIVSFLREYELDSDTIIYYNNKRRFINYGGYDEKANRIEENINPLDYFKYVADKHIISMSFEGPFLEEKFGKVLEEYGLYYELGNAWNLSCYPSSIDIEDIEYTDYTKEKEPEPESVWRMNNVPVDIQKVMFLWQSAVRIYGVNGSIIVGDGIYFKYEGKPYFMSTNYNQSDSVDKVIEIVKDALKQIGATEIRYDYGRMN